MIFGRGGREDDRSMSPQTTQGEGKVGVIIGGTRPLVRGILVRSANGRFKSSCTCPEALARTWTVTRFLWYWLSELDGQTRPTTMRRYHRGR